jgi:hypothetical protein
MSNTQIITIPLSSDIDPAQLLEIAQALLEDLEDAINDAGSECEIDEQDVSVSTEFTKQRSDGKSRGFSLRCLAESE